MLVSSYYSLPFGAMLTYYFVVGGPILGSHFG